MSPGNSCSVFVFLVVRVVRAKLCAIFCRCMGVFRSRVLVLFLLLLLQLLLLQCAVALWCPAGLLPVSRSFFFRMSKPRRRRVRQLSAI